MHVSKYVLSLAGSLCFATGLLAQFAPPVGQAGTTAIHKDSSAIVDWAVSCRVNRGYMDVSNPGNGYASVGDSSLVLGIAGSNGVISLGDGGSATVQFNLPVKDGPGPDLAVFENGFDDLFLELAFVEASSDGANFFRFPAVSNTDTTLQTGSFDNTDATKIHNLAGKYRALYGTPFDLADIPDNLLLNKQAVTYIRIIDVVGCIQTAYCSRDKDNHIVNDPWPTGFASGGFDLDAVAVLHNQTNTGIYELSENNMSLYPNPCADIVSIRMHSSDYGTLQLYSTDGRIQESYALENGYLRLNTAHLPPGVYLLQLRTEQGICQRKLLKY